MTVPLLGMKSGGHVPLSPWPDYRRKAHHRVARPAKTRLQNSGSTGPKFTNFLSDEDVSSAVLMRASALRPFFLLWNASAQNEGGYTN